MVSRRVNATPYFQDEQDFPGLDLGSLANLQSLDSSPLDFSSIMKQVAQPTQVDTDFQFPNIPDYQGQDLVGVDDVPGIPKGIELLSDLMGVEEEEDLLDSFSDTSPIPLQEYDALPQEDTIDDQGMYEQLTEGLSDQPPEVTDYLESKELPLDRGLLPNSVELAASIGPIDSSEITEELITEVSQDGTEAVQGTIELARQDENFIEEASRFMGVESGDIPPEIFDRAEILQNFLTKKEEQYTAQEKVLNEKLKKGNLSTLDKVGLGLAVVAPIIMGMLYGKEAFLGALSGGLEGFSKGKIEGEKSLTETSKQLSQIQSKKDELVKGRADLKKELAASVENPKLRKFIKNNEVFKNYTEDGEAKTTLGKGAKQFGDKLGITSRDEEGILWMNSNNLRDDGDLENFKKVSKDANEAMGRIKETNLVVDQVTDLMKAVRDQNPTALKAISEGVASIMDGIVPKSLKNLYVDYMGDDGKVSRVKALPLMQQKMGALQDSYNKQFLGRAILTKTVQDHWPRVFPDLGSIKSWLGSDYPTMLRQSNEFKNTLSRRATEEFAASGFIREPIEEALITNHGQYLEPTSDAMREIEENPDKFRKFYKRGL